MSTSTDLVTTSLSPDNVATVVLNRPDVNNAYNTALVEQLEAAFEWCATNPEVRVVWIRGAGRHFQAGADLAWLQEVRAQSEEDNLAVSMRTTNLLRSLNEFPKPTVALVHGGCFGGGVGIIAACDVVVAESTAQFGITESRWGMVGAPLVRQVAGRIGPARLRRYAMSSERFDAARAFGMGLVDELTEPGGLDEGAQRITDEILSSGPEAIAATKRSILRITGQLIDDDEALEMSQEHAARRLSAEAGAGLQSYLDRTPPPWKPATASVR
ncbi:enoyl-CoA hydratase-related protein [Georgenia yuyongxinii]|uniref:enoyl-CoA hydratase-related protein n=1 Tax=Georgenia yuyongxinii TaxID=2589797 RepID=UPI001CB6DC00|nr:enoyl-CoA hydratase-related protein [Georgenia yuyongxinii]